MFFQPSICLLFLTFYFIHPVQNQLSGRGNAQNTSLSSVSVKGAVTAQPRGTEESTDSASVN